MAQFSLERWKGVTDTAPVSTDSSIFDRRASTNVVFSTTAHFPGDARLRAARALRDSLHCYHPRHY